MNRFFIKDFWIKFSTFLIVIIYLFFLYMDVLSKDLGNRYSIGLKYLTVILCFVMSLLIGSDRHSKKDKFLVQLARLFTLIADYFIVLFDEYKFGVFFFCLVQIAYIIRHSIMEKKKHKNFVFLIVALMLALLMSLNINIIKIERNLVILTLVYASLLTTSLYCAISTINRGHYSKQDSWIIAIGMFLFFMCDLNVGLFNIIKKESIKFFVGFLIWLFYLPSQLLLTLSGFRVEYLRKLFLNKG